MDLDRNQRLCHISREEICELLKMSGAIRTQSNDSKGFTVWSLYQCEVEKFVADLLYFLADHSVMIDGGKREAVSVSTVLERRERVKRMRSGK